MNILNYLINRNFKEDFILVVNILIVYLIIKSFFLFVGVFYSNNLDLIFLIFFSFFFLKLCLFPYQDLNWKEKIMKLFFLLFIFLIFLTFNYNFSISADNGSYSNWGVYINQEGRYYTLDDSFLTSPVLSIKDGYITSSFLPGYTIYLSIFSYNYFLVNLANFPLLVLFSFLLFFISKELFTRKYSFVPPIIFLVSYTTIWFSKQNYSEILFGFLIFYSIYLLILWTKENKLNYLLLSFISILFTLLVRGEAWLNLIVFFIFIGINFKKISFNFKRKYFLYYSLIILFILSLIIYLIKFDQSYFLKNFSFFYTFFKSFFSTNAPISTQGTISIHYLLFLTFDLLLWNLFFLLGFFFFMRKTLRVSLAYDNLKIIFPFLLIIPSLFFLYYPSINPEIPYLLRRYCFTLLPIISFFPVIFISNFNEKNFKKIFLFLLILILFLQSSFLFKHNLDGSDNIKTILSPLKENCLVLYKTELSNFVLYLKMNDYHPVYLPRSLSWSKEIYPSYSPVSEFYLKNISNSCNLILVSDSEIDINANLELNNLGIYNLNFLRKEDISFSKLESSLDFVLSEISNGRDISDMELEENIYLPKEFITSRKTIYFYRINLRN